MTAEELATLAAGGRIWTVTLTAEEVLTTTVIAGNDTDEATLRELALLKADAGEACWDTVWAETKVRWV